MQFLINCFLLKNIADERREKLEQLAKTPLIENLIPKIKSVSDDKLKQILNTLTTDTLLNIDEILESGDES